MTKAPSTAPTVTMIEVELGPGSVPEWVAHIISSLEGLVPASVWLEQFSGDWNDIPAIRDACDYASTYRWMSREDFVRKLNDPDAIVDVPQQRMERFIVVEVLKELSPKLNRSMVIKITRSLAANLMSHAFQRVSADYTWDRVVFDTIPFMVDFAEKMLADVVQEPSTPDFLPRSTMSTDNSVKLYAWHLYIEMESMTARLSTARAVATEIVTKSREMPLHECCKGFGYVASDVAAVLVAEHRQNGDAARLIDSEGNTNLHYAIQRKEDDGGRLIRVLYSAGANVNARNNLGQTPLAFGCANAAAPRAIEELLQLGANPRLTDNYGLTPLHFAVRVQRGNLVRLLCDHGVDLNAADKDGFTPAHFAASSGSVCMLELLASLGSCLEKPSRTGLTPLAVASRRHHLHAVLFLFQTRNYLAARHPDDLSYSMVLAVLKEQLPEVGKVPQISISALGLDHLPPEIGYLRFTRRFDVRHNSLKTFWMTPWWWVPVFSRKFNSMIQVAFFFFWTVFVLAGIFSPSSNFPGSPNCPYVFRAHHFYIILSVMISSVFLLSSLRSSFISSNSKIERKTMRFVFFRLANYANLVSLCELFIEHIQLSALAYSSSRASSSAKFFRAFLFDFGTPNNRNLIAVSIGLIYFIRVWIECRSFIPKFWSYDRYLMWFISILYMPLCRSLMTNFLEDMSDPTSIVLLLFGVGSFFSVIPMAIYGEVALQARDGLRQIRPRPVSIVMLRTFFLVLLTIDVIMNQPWVPGQRYERMIACWLLPAAMILSAILGKRVLVDETLMIRASPIWAALIHAICLTLRPKRMPETFALISGPISLLILVVMICLSRLKNGRKFTERSREFRSNLKRDVMFQCFRLHPQFKDILRDFESRDLAEIQRKYELDRWLRDRFPSFVQAQIVPLMTQIEQNLPSPKSAFEGACFIRPLHDDDSYSSVWQRMPYRVTVKLADEADGSVTGFSFVVEEGNFDSFIKRVQAKFQLSSSKKLILLDSSQVPISNTNQLFDRQQLELRIVSDSDSSNESNDFQDDAAEAKFEPEEEWIVDHRFCMYPGLIETHKGKMKCQEMVHQISTFGATFTSKSGILVAPNFSGELRVHPSILPGNLPPSFSISDLANRLWIIALCHGGFFAGAVLQSGAVIAHKTLHRYVQRRKQGKRQSNHDSGSRSGGHTTVGSQIRRKQEAEFRLDLQKLMMEWTSHFNAADLVFVHAPGKNRTEMFFEDGPIASSDSRIRPVPISTGRAILHEALRVARTLATIEIATAKSE